MYSNIPKGVIITVLGIDVSSIVIWWYALNKSIFMKMVLFVKFVVKSCMYGMEYLFGMVLLLSKL